MYLIFRLKEFKKDYVIAFYVVFFTQVVASIARLHFSNDCNFNITYPIPAYLNFLYSPMLTVLLLWFITQEVYKSNIKMQPFAVTLAGGWFSSVIITNLTISYDLQTAYIIFITCLLGSCIEFSFTKSNICYTLVWYLGTWLFYLPMLWKGV